MLASKCEDVSKLRFPVLGTPKMDGIRTLTIPPQVFLSKNQRCLPVSRNMRQVPNNFIRGRLMATLMPGMDGEMMATNDPREPWEMPIFRECSSCIMGADGFPSFRYYIFDVVPELMGGIRDPGYQARCEVLAQLHLPDYCIRVLPVTIPDADHLAAYEAACIDDGYEGCMIRTPDSPYKYGRSTFKEQWLVKIKRFADSEAEVLEVIEKMTNNNPAEKNSLGYQERSTHAENMTPAGVMGALRCRDLKSKVEFQVGTGFDDILRTSVWAFRDTYIGATLKYKYQPHGTDEKPRFPVFIGWRHRGDL